MPISTGTLFEYRVARLRFAQGAFVRRNINLWDDSTSKNVLAEVDCICVQFDPMLNRSVEVVECKSGSGGSGEIDRLLWMEGIANLFDAQTATFAKLAISSQTRAFATNSAVGILDGISIDNIEAMLKVDMASPLGFHDAEFGETVVKKLRQELISSQELRRAGRFLFGSFWKADDFTRIKQLQTLLNLIQEGTTNVSPGGIDLVTGESIALLTLSVFSIARMLNHFSEQDFTIMVTNGLTTGLGEANTLRRLLHYVDTMRINDANRIHDLYTSQGTIARKEFQLSLLEEEVLRAPEWTEALVDLCKRFWGMSIYVSDAMRWIDLWAAERLGSPQSSYQFRSDPAILHSILQTIVDFVTRFWRIDESFFVSPITKPPLGQPF